MLNCSVGEDSSESLGLQGDQASQSQRKLVLNIHWKDWCWSWNSNTLATWCEELPHWKRPWCWERLKAGEEGGDGGWDGCMASLTQWTWVWTSSGSGWWTGKPGVLQPMGSQRVGQEWVNWIDFQSLSPGWWRGQWQPTPVLLPGESHGRRSLVGCSPWGLEESDTTERLHFHALEKEMLTHSNVLAWRIPGTAEPGGLPSMGSHRVGHDWSNLVAAPGWHKGVKAVFEVYIMAIIAADKGGTSSRPDHSTLTEEAGPPFNLMWDFR